jgi:hypothetical protein
MATTTRQATLFSAENWTKIYQTFREADFQSYDFETLRKTMIDYLRTYYPEDFNDYIESSEYIALIELIAFLGQSISFRTDLNARENFLETAERRDSVLRLAKMLSYVPKRHVNAKGVLKVASISTTEDVFDSNGVNLRGLEVIWNDTTNSDFFEQFAAVMNAAFASNQKFGKPSVKKTLLGVRNEIYQVNTPTGVLPRYAFRAKVDGINMPFELVSADLAGKDYLYEPSPSLSSEFNLLYKNDSRGNASADTGFFFYFKQGELKSTDFTISQRLDNRIVNINVDNVNNDDVWLYKLDENGVPAEEWSKVPAVVGSNIAYNSLEQDQRKIFSVNTRNNDQIDLIFGDGVFAEIPTGDFRLFYRTSNGAGYRIKPSEISNTQIEINYISRAGQLETLTVGLALQYTVANAVERESISDIRVKAPQQYYTQNRMVNGEDYNVYPLTQYTNIIKSKAVNRTSSGISRFLDVKDTTGKYSSTNVFCDDGLFYRNEFLSSFTFEWTNTNDILQVVRGDLLNIINDPDTLHFYLAKYGNVDMINLSTLWERSSVGTNASTGYFSNGSTPQGVGAFVGNARRNIVVGSLIKFVAPAGYYFNLASGNKLEIGTPSGQDQLSYIWCGVNSIIDDGTNQGLGNLSDGSGPVALNQNIPSGAVVETVVPPFNTTLSTVSNDIVSSVTLYKDFGLRFDRDSRTWKIITAGNLDKTSEWSIDNAGDATSTGRDASWIVLFETDGQTYTVKYRGISLLFESVIQTRFYFDANTRIFDSATGRTIDDQIVVLGINSEPDSTTGLNRDYALFVEDVILESDGYVDNKKVKVTFPDIDKDGIIDNPEIFDIVVAPEVNSSQKYVFFEKQLNNQNYINFSPYSGQISTDYTTLELLQNDKNLFANNSLFYTTAENRFYKIVENTQTAEKTCVNVSDDYLARVGRDSIKFQYKHNAPNNRRIDPSPSNIIDLFLLTKNYEQAYRNYAQDFTGTVALPRVPTVEQLKTEFSALETVKSVSDSIIYNHARFKPLFGNKAQEELQASFKVVKNSNTVVTDSEVKSQLIAAVNRYFSIENWDFGETFYFSELSAYLHNELRTIASSIVLVPTSNNQTFGSLYEIKCQPDEIFISSATVDNVDIIDSITADKIKAEQTTSGDYV